MMRLEDVGVCYTSEKPVLRSVSLHLEPGGFYFLTGPSGAGKSTLLRILGLTMPATQGDIHIFGEDVRHLSHDRLLQMRRKIGMVFQDYQLIDHLTVGDNIALPLKVAGEQPTAIRAKVHELLDWVGLARHTDDYPPTLSGGMKQRAAIARAVINNPQVLLADEPTGNLDPSLALKFMYLFQALNKMGTTILFATHDENLIAMFDYPVLRLKDGVLANRTRMEKESS